MQGKASALKKTVIAICALMFVAGLDFRFGWSNLPGWVPVCASVVFLVYPFAISARIISEEKLLKNELDGYLEYEKKVRYRLIPFVR